MKRITHLYRGAPCARAWSKYQQTVLDVALCGVNQRQERIQCVEDPRPVDCPQCVRLMHPGACATAKTPCGFCEAEKAKSKTKGKALAATQS